MTVVSPTAKAQFIDAAGIPLAGGFVYTYAAGTTTPQATYTDSTGATANSNPIVLDARGEANIWLGSATYKFKLTDSNNTEIWTVDNISAPTSGVSPVLSGNVTISSDSPGTALTITQTGTGPALKVEDTSSDPTPFVVDADGKVGIGTISPATSLDVNDGTIQLSSSGTSRATLAADASNTTLTSVGSRGLILNANSTNLIYGTSSGYVGIKNASPTVELDVTGAAKASGAITAGTTLASGTTLTAGSSLTVTTSASIGTTLSVDTVQEKTAAAGVSVSNTLKVDTISGKTTATTITIAGVSITSSQVAAANRLITADTAKASTSGTTVEFTTIPSWAKRVTLMLDSVSLSGTDNLLLQLGNASTYATTNYTGSYTYLVNGGALSSVSNSTSFLIGSAAGGATITMSGVVTIVNITSNTWVISSNVGLQNFGAFLSSGGSVAVGGVLTRLKLLTNGTNTFDAGTVNILYE
jgi:hypothetical protein